MLDGYFSTNQFPILDSFALAECTMINHHTKQVISLLGIGKQRFKSKKEYNSLMNQTVPSCLVHSYLTKDMSAVFGERVCISSIVAFSKYNTTSCHANNISINLIIKYTNIFFNF